MHRRLATAILFAIASGVIIGCGGSGATAARCERFERRDGLQQTDLLKSAVRDCVADVKNGKPKVYNWTMRRSFGAAVKPVLMDELEAIVPDDPPDEIGGVACQVVIGPNCSVDLIWDQATPTTITYGLTLHGACWTATPRSMTNWEQGPGAVADGARGAVDAIPSELSTPVSGCLSSDLLP
jgi:hypothetical protein